MSGTASETTLPVADLAEATHPAAGTPAIEVRGMYRFFGRLKAVNNVSFRAWPGQVIGFIGPNGAGKTTTMRILATLDVPTAGDAFVCGYSVIDDPDRVRQLMGFMPDSFGRYANMNVVEYLDFYARGYGFRGTRRRDAVERVMVFTELNRIPDKSIETLSKGLAQRLGLARTLIHDPEVLILDEPAAGLDPRARVELRELIRLMSEQLKKTILISSHILTELGEICDAAVIIEAGKLLASGTVDELKSAQRQVTGQSSHIQLVKVLGETSELERWLNEQPFVRAVAPAGPQQLSFAFAGNEEESSRLLKVMIERGYPVIAYQTKTESLEDTFMAITKGIMQ